MSFTPFSRELARDRDVAGLRHAAGARPSAAQDQRVVGVDVEVGRVDARREIGEILEDDGAELALEERLVGGGALEDGAVGREAAEQGDDAALLAHGLLHAPDHRVVDPILRLGKRLAQASRR